MGFDVFDDLVAQEFLDPERRQRHAQTVKSAYVEINASLGAFLRNAKNDDEFRSRLALVSSELQSAFSRHKITSADQGKIIERLKTADELGGNFTTKPIENTATEIPWEQAGPTPQQDSSNNPTNDATLEHVSKKKTADALQGIDVGDTVIVTQSTADGYTGQDIDQGSQWMVETIRGSEAELYSGVSSTGHVDSYVTLPVQVLQKIGQKRIKMAQWTWDSDSNSYKSSVDTLACRCGNKISGVGQHQCACGKVWNIASILNGAKTATDAPTYSAREVKTDSRFVLADAQNNGTGNNDAKGGPGESLDPEQPDLDLNGLDSDLESDSYVEPFNAHGKGARVARMLFSEAGMWPLIGDKDLQANWKALMSIITDPTQVGVLEHQGYQGLIQELYEEINRRGLATPIDPMQPDQSGQSMDGQPVVGQPTPQAPGIAEPQPQPQPGPQVQPGQQVPQQQGQQQTPTLVSPGEQLPSQSALSAVKTGFNAALAGIEPSTDEPIQVLQGYVLGLNQKLSDSYSDRTTDFTGSEPVDKEESPVNDYLNYEQNIDDPTPSQRSDTARDTDLVNTHGQSDEDSANHVDDFEPKGQKHTRVSR